MTDKITKAPEYLLHNQKVLADVQRETPVHELDVEDQTSITMAQVGSIMSDKQIDKQAPSLDQGATVKRMMGSVESTVQSLQFMCPDPEIIHLLESFLGDLAHAAWQVQASRMSEARARNIKETLQQALKTLDPNRDPGSRQAQRDAEAENRNLRP